MTLLLLCVTYLVINTFKDLIIDYLDSYSLYFNNSYLIFLVTIVSTIFSVMLILPY